MAASAWVFFNEAKKYLMTGDIDLDTDTFYISLHTSAWTPDATLSTYTSVGNEVTNGNGYTTGGNAITVTWASGASASEYRFTYTSSLYWSANGASIQNIRYAVLRAALSAGGGDKKVVAYAALSTGQFSVSDTNRLTVSPDATNGVFELN